MITIPIPMRAVAACLVVLIASACGTAQTAQSTTTTTRPQLEIPGQQTVTAGHLTFALPTSWTVGYGVCRCSWGTPDSAMLDNGPQQGGVQCSCPMMPADGPSGLHLYEGATGLVPGGRPTTINGLRAEVRFETSTSTLTATFPGVDQWITIGPAPESPSIAITQQQVAQERRILATVRSA